MWLEVLPVGLSQFQQGHHPTQCPPGPGGSGSNRGTSKTKASPEARAPAWCLACPAGLWPWLGHPCPVQSAGILPLCTPHSHSLHPPHPPAPFLLSWLYLYFWVSLWPVCLSLCHPTPPSKASQALLSQPLHPSTPRLPHLPRAWSSGSLLLSPALFPALLGVEWEQEQISCRPGLIS